jgi:4-amino-4-deoxy-L-arabinose transferase-like glycosyltransferase
MKTSEADKRPNSVLSVLIIGLIIRLIDIAKPFSGLGKWNEGHYAMTALNYFNYGIFLPMNEYGLDLTTVPLYSWLIYISFITFGIHEWAARLPSLIFGMLSLIFVYHISKRLYDEKVALTATFIAAVSPGIAYFSRNIQLESMFTAFTLAAVLFLIYYKETEDTRWMLASGVYLSIAILTKYPAILAYPALLWVLLEKNKFKSSNQEKIRVFLYIILPVIPTLVWLLYAASTKPALTAWYFNKPEAPWSYLSAKTALYLAVTKYIPEHFGYLFYVPFLLILPLAIKEFKKHTTILIFLLPWLLLITFFPDFYLSNMYYHYTMLYGMAILLGFYVIKASENVKKGFNINLKIFKIVTIVIVLLLSMYQYNIYFHSYYTDFTKANETEPFQSAKHVARINKAHELVVVDFPMTMFYAGADPAYVKPAYYTEGILDAINQDKYSYFVVYYSANATMRRVLEEHNYTQIAPRAWYRNISNSRG